MRDASKRVAKSLFLIAPKLRAFKSIRFFRISHLDTRINDQIRDESKRVAKSAFSVALRIPNLAYSHLTNLFASLISTLVSLYKRGTSAVGNLSSNS